jgi:hypothetical protein
MNNDLEESDRGLTEVLSWHLPGGTEENTESLSRQMVPRLRPKQNTSRLQVLWVLPLIL